MDSSKRMTAFAIVAIGFIVIGIHGKTDREILRSLLHRYSSDEPPQETTAVRLGIYVNSFYQISEQTMDYSLSMYLRQSWQDKRLEFQESGKKINIPDSTTREIWVPDTFIRNEKRASFHQVTVPNRLMRLNETGHIWFVTKVSATLSCPMRLQKYPFDTQMCPMKFESFSHTMDTLYYQWLDTPVDVDKSVQLPQFTLIDIILYDCSQNYTAGAFPCLEIRYVLQRDVGFYILQVYIPVILITLLSWFTFWFPVNAVAARVGIGLTTVLTSVLLSAWSRYQLPKISYATAMDVWNFVCFVFIMLAFLEFVLVQFFSKRGDDQEKRESGSSTLQRLGDNADKICRIAFPVVFLVFMIIYFATYAS